MEVLSIVFSPTLVGGAGEPLVLLVQSRCPHLGTCGAWVPAGRWVATSLALFPSVWERSRCFLQASRTLPFFLAFLACGLVYCSH